MSETRVQDSLWITLHASTDGWDPKNGVCKSTAVQSTVLVFCWGKKKPVKRQRQGWGGGGSDCMARGGRCQHLSVHGFQECIYI